MDYLEARAFLKEKEALGSVYGLSVMRELLKRLGNPERKLKAVHVAGTNGKGSVVAFTASILKQAGYRVGCYTSPAVFAYEEIIRIGDDFIPKEAVARLISRIKEAAEEMVRDGFSHPTVFEMETAMAFCHFMEQDCQLVCIECGLGGKDDGTNVIENPVCTAFTPISWDHMGILGNRLLEIGEAKAGIIKAGAYVVSAPQEREVREALEKRAKEKGCRIWFCQEMEGEGKGDLRDGGGFPDEEKLLFSYGNYRNIELGLLGLYQRENAALALEIIECLTEAGYEIPEEAVRIGMYRAKWPGRLQKVSERPDFYLDGAHNEGACRKLAQSVKFYFTNRKICYIMGVFRDKEYEKMLEIMAPYAKSLITVTAPGARGLDGEKLAGSGKKWYPDVYFADDYEEAVEAAKKKTGPEGVVLAFGSLSYLGEIGKLLAGEKYE